MLLVRCSKHLGPHHVLLLAVCLVRQLLQHKFLSASPSMGKKSQQGVSVVPACLLPDQLVQVLPKLVLVHMVDAPQVDLR